ncbi:Variant surface glycoprotein [Trypanosoma congolense IL3000]|uniref:Variant surface glycoprotein n=1 Tax=Trypanosoma congolense (strain IL3000) TaxID=1068625 RepID=F9WHN3_TRYCI|nr:Variant surface glycoprotein [Trypanosoma congolense IL3000]
MCGKVSVVMALLSVRFLVAEGYNDGVFKKLCDVLRKTRALYKLEKDNSTLKKSLEQAIYGTQTTALFNDDGGVEINQNCGGLKMRSYLCTFYGGAPAWHGKDGCLAESLFGTIMCVCTPGDSKSGIINFCGVDIKNYKGKTWSGKWLNSEEQNELIKKVLREVNEKCPEDGGHGLQGEAKLKDLKNSLDALKEKLKPTIGGNFFYFGENGWGGCSGTNGDNVCASYKGSMANKKNINIPWMQKIVTTLEDLSKTVETQARTLDATSSAHSTPEASGTLPESRENAENAKAAVQVKHSADEKNEDIGLLESEVENSGNPESSVVESSTARTTGENRTTTHHHLTEIPHITNNPNEDGFLITSKFSFILAALLN